MASEDLVSYSVLHFGVYDLVGSGLDILITRKSGFLGFLVISSLSDDHPPYLCC